MDRPLRIGQLAETSGIGIETIRYYERRGLLPAPRRTAAGYRQYGEKAVQQLAFVRRAQNLGFSLDEIARLLSLQDGGGKAEVKNLTESKLVMVQNKIDDLVRIRDTLQELAGRCSGRGNVDGCPIIESLSGEAPG